MTGFGAAILLANKNGSEFHQTLTKLKDANRENVAATEANYDSTQRSISILEQLNEVESLSANQKGRVREEVDRLNSIYPGLNLTIDEQTGKVQQNTDKIRENSGARPSRSRRSMTSRAWVPMEPVDPSRTTAAGARLVWLIVLVHS